MATEGNNVNVDWITLKIPPYCTKHAPSPVYYYSKHDKKSYIIFTPNYNDHDCCSKYDTTEDKYIQLAPYPLEFKPSSHIHAIDSNDRLLVWSPYSKKLGILNLLQNQWEIKQIKPIRNFHSGTVISHFIDDYIHIYCDNGPHIKFDCITHDYFIIRGLSTIKNPISSCAILCDNDKLYLCGGFASDPNKSDKIWAFDIEENDYYSNWQISHFTLPQPMTFHMSPSPLVVLSNIFIIFQKAHINSQYDMRVYYLDKEDITKQWNEIYINFNAPRGWRIDIIITNDYYLHFINTIYGSYHWKVSLKQILPQHFIERYERRIVAGFIYKSCKKKEKYLCKLVSVDIIDLILHFFSDISPNEGIGNDNDKLIQTLSDDLDPEEIFDILMPIGEGAYGSVYKALDKRDGNLVALKIMPLETEWGNLEKEVSIMKRCNSVYIVQFKGAFLKDENIWLAMEYCGAGSVIDIMRATNKMFTEDEICVVIRETLRGLMYLHSIKLIHRDIKSGNILLNRKGQCKLADFGISKAFENTIAAAKTVIGTPYWMAPEIFTDGTYNTGADIWSLGITAIEMAVGKPPHCDKSPLQAIFFIPQSDAPNLPQHRWCDFSNDFIDFISNCCIKNPNDRPSAKDLLTHKWIEKAKGICIIQELIHKSQPLIEALRKKKKEEEQAEMFEEEMKEYDNKMDENEYNNDDDEYNDGTMIRNAEEIELEEEYNDRTMILNDDRTMLIHDDIDDDQQDIIDNVEYNELEEEYNYNDGTMIRNDRTMLIHDDINDEQEDIIDNGTMLIHNNDETMLIYDECVNVKVFKSMLENHKCINKLLPIPNDVTKKELFSLWEKVKSITENDTKNLETFYKEQIEKVNQMIEQCENND